MHIEESEEWLAQLERNERVYYRGLFAVLRAARSYDAEAERDGPSREGRLACRERDLREAIKYAYDVMHPKPCAGRHARSWHCYQTVICAPPIYN